MTTTIAADKAGFKVDSRLMTIGVALVAAGGVLGVAGVALTGTALGAALRRWVNELEEPPADMMRRYWAQTKAATAAGASAWQNGTVPSGAGR